jgi:ABC-type glycerol-3-phosphate transport system substrate-binding protein
MKKLLAIISLVGVMALALVACGNGAASTSSTPASEPATSVSDEVSSVASDSSVAEDSSVSEEGGSSVSEAE